MRTLKKVAALVALTAAAVATPAAASSTSAASDQKVTTNVTIDTQQYRTHTFPI